MIVDYSGDMLAPLFNGYSYEQYWLCGAATVVIGAQGESGRVFADAVIARDQNRSSERKRPQGDPWDPAGPTDGS
jgi:hypothetical protein